MKSLILGLLAFALIGLSGVALSAPITYDYTVEADPLAANADPLNWFVEASLASGGSVSGTFDVAQFEWIRRRILKRTYLCR